MKHPIVRLIMLFVKVYLILLALIFLFQEKLLFYPRSYTTSPSATLRLTYETTSGKQTAYYFGTRDRPENLWIVFSGNGSLALNWSRVAEQVIDQDPVSAVVLFDYPGYGINSGKPGRQSIRESADALFGALSEETGYSTSELSNRTSVLGQSLGAAVAAESAASWGVSTVIAISPFTSMQEMANRKISPLLGIALRHRWNTREALQQVLQQPEASVHLYHGIQDSLIPVSMSRELRALASDRITLEEVPRAGHNDVVAPIRKQLLAQLRRTSG